MGKPITDSMYVHFHVGRSWEGHRIEDACKCIKAPCGLVSDEDPECDQHGIKAARTLRQHHRADECPGAVHGIPHDGTPEADLAAKYVESIEPVPDAAEKALEAAWQTHVNAEAGMGHECYPGCASDVCAALDGWTLVPRVATADWTGSTRKDAEIARLRATLVLYGVHSRVCAYDLPTRGSCICGFRAALAEGSRRPNSSSMGSVSVAAIEAEAVAARNAEIAEAVRRVDRFHQMSACCDCGAEDPTECDLTEPHTPWFDPDQLAAILAIIEGETP